MAEVLIRPTMPFELVWEPRGVYRRYYGDVPFAERRASFDLICADRRFDDLRYAITDYLGVTTYEISDESTMEIAALHTGPLRTNPDIAIAAVVCDPRIVATIEQFIALKVVSAPYRFFPTLPDARAWVSGLGEPLPRRRP